MSDDIIPTEADAGAPDGETLAAEFALGVLDGVERTTAMRLMLSDPEFAASVLRWRAHFERLFDVWPEAAPPADGLARLERALRPAPANDPAPTLGLWQTIAGLASLVAASLIVMIAVRPATPPTTPGPAPVQVAARQGVLVAAMVPVKAGAPVAAVYDPASGDLRVAAATLADPGHSAELWVIAKDGVPRSLGLLAAGAGTASAVAAPERPRLHAGSTLAVTVEPIGGAPGGKPTGPVVAAGPLVLI